MLDKLSNLAKGGVPQAVMEGIQAVMADGKVDMSDIPAVAAAAEKLGFGEAATWVKENSEKYLGMFGGGDDKGGSLLGNLNPFK